MPNSLDSVIVQKDADHIRLFYIAKDNLSETGFWTGMTCCIALVSFLITNADSATPGTQTAPAGIVALLTTYGFSISLTRLLFNEHFREICIIGNRKIIIRLNSFCVDEIDSLSYRQISTHYGHVELRTRSRKTVTLDGLVGRELGHELIAHIQRFLKEVWPENRA